MNEELDKDTAALLEAVAKMTPGPWAARMLYRERRVARKYAEAEGLLYNVGPENDWADSEGIEALHNLAPGLLRRWQERAKKAEDWKESAMTVESQWDCQAVASALGIGLGQSIRPAILPAIDALKAENGRLRAAATDFLAACELGEEVDPDDSYDAYVGSRQALRAALEATR